METIYFVSPQGAPVPSLSGYVFSLPCTVRLVLQQNASDGCTAASLNSLSSFSVAGGLCSPSISVLQADVTDSLFRANQVQLGGSSDPVDVIRMLNVISLATGNTLHLWNATSSCSK